MVLKMVVDRIEDNLAVLLVDFEDSEKSFNFPLQLLPKDVEEGDILNFLIDVDKDETKRKKEQLETIVMNLLKNRNN